MITNGRALIKLQPAMRDAAIEFVSYLSDQGRHVTITSGVRSPMKQRQLWNAYLRRLSRGEPTLPAAAPGTSPHERGLAFDCTIDGRFPGEDVGRLWESIGGSWGGRFKDPVHFGVYPSTGGRTGGRR